MFSPTMAKRCPMPTQRTHLVGGTTNDTDSEGVADEFADGLTEEDVEEEKKKGKCPVKKDEDDGDHGSSFHPPLTTESWDESLSEMLILANDPFLESECVPHSSKICLLNALPETPTFGLRQADCFLSPSMPCFLQLSLRRFLLASIRHYLTALIWCCMSASMRQSRCKAKMVPTTRMTAIPTTFADPASCQHKIGGFEMGRSLYVASLLTSTLHASYKPIAPFVNVQCNYKQVSHSYCRLQQHLNV
ncbi:hypothetical protein GGR57DRAFT_253036 [Xylariaceae sp. FL1272]|nr:hypothetical protein GGR57DRAFT_253036 [Xylariaceae sp. FL1272]